MRTLIDGLEGARLRAAVLEAPEGARLRAAITETVAGAGGRVLDLRNVPDLAEVAADDDYDCVVSALSLPPGEALAQRLERVLTLLAPGGVLRFCEFLGEQGRRAQPGDLTGVMWATGWSVTDFYRFEEADSSYVVGLARRALTPTQ